MNDFRIFPNLFFFWVSEIYDYRRVHLPFTTPISWRIGRKISDVFKRHWCSTTFSTFWKPIKLIFNYKKIKDSQFWLLITFITKVPHYWAQHFSCFQALSQKDPLRMHHRLIVIKSCFQFRPITCLLNESIDVAC